VRLRAALFSPSRAARGSVILSGGRTEPIEKYYETIDDFLTRGFCVVAHDWRGQGLSTRLSAAGDLGHAQGWRPFVADLTGLMDLYASRLPQPWIAVGHSMGAGLTALALAEGERRFAAVLLSAPMIAVQLGGRNAQALAALCRVMALVGQGSKAAGPPPPPPSFETNILTHDAERWRRAQSLALLEPGLGLGGFTWGWLGFALALSRRLKRERGWSSLQAPLVVVAAGEERLVVNAAARLLVSRLPNARYLELAGAFHEILMETDPIRAAALAEFDALTGAL
jgi:lysophospholipase